MVCHCSTFLAIFYFFSIFSGMQALVLCVAIFSLFSCLFWFVWANTFFLTFFSKCWFLIFKRKMCVCCSQKFHNFRVWFLDSLMGGVREKVFFTYTFLLIFRFFCTFFVCIHSIVFVFILQENLEKVVLFF